MTTDEFLLLYPRYMAHKDPTEYTFALEAFGGYQAWKAFSEQESVLPIIQKWREELVLKLRSESLARILEAARGETRDALSANKYIYETLGETNRKNSVGRPSKESIVKEAHRLLEEDKIRDEAYNRIFNE